VFGWGSGTDSVGLVFVIYKVGFSSVSLCDPMAAQIRSPRRVQILCSSGFEIDDVYGHFRLLASNYAMKCVLAVTPFPVKYKRQ
jgi:hypothetical protein